MPMTENDINNFEKRSDSNHPPNNRLGAQVQFTGIYGNNGLNPDWNDEIDDAMANGKSSTTFSKHSSNSSKQNDGQWAAKLIRHPNFDCN